MVKFQRLQASVSATGRATSTSSTSARARCRPTRETVIGLARHRHAPIVVNQDGVAYPAWAGADTERLNARHATCSGRRRTSSTRASSARRRPTGSSASRQGAWEILQNAVDTTAFTPDDGSPDGPPVILLSRRPVAGVPPGRSALETLALLPDARMLVAGTVVGGQELIGELGLRDRVELVGRYTQRDAPALYRRAHVLLHPKVGDPCPNVVLEALACGVPVVHSAAVACRSSSVTEASACRRRRPGSAMCRPRREACRGGRDRARGRSTATGSGARARRRALRSRALDRAPQAAVCGARGMTPVGERRHARAKRRAVPARSARLDARADASPSLELIVVDDGSTDATPAILAEVAAARSARPRPPPGAGRTDGRAQRGLRAGAGAGDRPHGRR